MWYICQYFFSADSVDENVDLTEDEDGDQAGGSSKKKTVAPLKIKINKKKRKRRGSDVRSFMSVFDFLNFTWIILLIFR